MTTCDVCGQYPLSCLCDDWHPLPVVQHPRSAAETTPQAAYELSDADYSESRTRHPRAAQELALAATASRLILAKLARRRHHGDWREDGPQRLHLRLADEVDEYLTAARAVYLAMSCDTLTPEHMSHLLDEATDVMACAAMVAELAEREMAKLEGER